MSIVRVDGRELPLSAIPLCRLFPCHLGPPRPTLSINLYVKGCLERSTCPYHRSLLSFRMRSRSSMPSHTTGGDNVLRSDIADLSDNCPVISLQTLVVWLCRWPSLTGMEHCALHTRTVHTATCFERQVA